MTWKQKYADKLVSADQAARFIKSGDKVVVAMFAEPRSILSALETRREELQDVTLLSHWVEIHPWFEPGWEKSFNIQSGFITPATRIGHRERRFDWVPSAFGLSDGLRHQEAMRGSIYANADVFLVKVSPPNKHGWCSFGHNIWYSPVAARTAKMVVVEVDNSVIWTYGDQIHISQIDYLVEGAIFEGLPATTAATPPVDDFEKAEVMGAHVASLMRDGDCFEIGTGTPSEMAMTFLEIKNNLSVDSEMIYPQMVDLIKKGVIDGKFNNIHPGKTLTTCLYAFRGDPRTPGAIDYVDQNPQFEFRDVSYICNVPRIASIDNMVSINTAIAVDLNGQAVISHLGPVPVSGPGGQVEYCIGSHYSKGGRSITCLLSTAKGGSVSRIVPQFEAGSVIMIPNIYVDYLVTEYGIANLDCKSARERAEVLISVAHPDFRDELRDAARKLFWP